MAKRASPAERDERRRKVAILLIAGVATNNIAETVGVNRKTVLLDSKAVRAEWARARIEAYDRYAAEQLVILAEVQRANWEATMRGDTKASTTVLRVCDQRARLLGLYAPLHLDVQDERLQSKSDFDREIKEHLARLDAADAAAAEAEARAILAGESKDSDETAAGQE
jgi:hypothetical protein